MLYNGTHGEHKIQSFNIHTMYVILVSSVTLSYLPYDSICRGYWTVCLPYWQIAERCHRTINRRDNRQVKLVLLIDADSSNVGNCQLKSSLYFETFWLLFNWIIGNDLWKFDFNGFLRFKNCRKFEKNSKIILTVKNIF